MLDLGGWPLLSRAAPIERARPDCVVAEGVTRRLADGVTPFALKSSTPQELSKRSTTPPATGWTVISVKHDWATVF
jgi:hypothetical protein